MSVTLNAGSVVAKPGQQISVASLVNVTSGSNPTYVVVSLLDRNEYTAASNGETGTLSGNGHTATFSNIGGDSNTVGIVFTYNAATGQYTNATYGNLSSLTYTASTNTNDNTSISIFTTNNSSAANIYANNPYDLQLLSTATYGNYTTLGFWPRASVAAAARQVPPAASSRWARAGRRAVTAAPLR